MAQRVSSPVFAGRADELAELVAAMTRAAEGTPGVVLVGGEAGVGKSRLLSELAALGVQDGLRVLLGQCVGLDEATIPLLPVTGARACGGSWPTWLPPPRCGGSLSSA
jgi:predicted ATPase